jgi:hypothetical protein
MARTDARLPKGPPKEGRELPQSEELDRLLEQVVLAALHWDRATGRIRYGPGRERFTVDSTFRLGLSKPEERSLARSIPRLRRVAGQVQRVVNSLLWSLRFVAHQAGSVRFPDRDLPDAIRRFAERFEAVRQNAKRFDESNLRFHVRNLFRFLRESGFRYELEDLAGTLNAKYREQLRGLGKALSEGDAKVPAGVDRTKRFEHRFLSRAGSSGRFSADMLQKYRDREPSVVSKKSRARSRTRTHTSREE